MKKWGYRGVLRPKPFHFFSLDLKFSVDRLCHCCLIAIGLYSLVACGGGGGGPAPLGGGFAVGSVEPLYFDPNGQAMVNFGELSGSEDFAFIMLAANVNEGNFNVQLKSGASSADPEDKFITTPSEVLKEVELGEDPTSAFHEILREEEYFLSQVYREEPSGGAKLLAGSRPEDIFEGSLAGASSAPTCANGTGLQIKVLNSLSSISTYDIVCALIRRTTDNAIYVVESVASNNLPDALLNTLIDEFESKIPLEFSLLGDVSDVDGNDRFVVCFCAGVNRLGNIAGGFITGYFFGIDLFDASDFASSNEMEIIYVAVPDPSGQWGVPISQSFYQTNIGPTVLPHELQHAISFNQKVLLRGSSPEESWANEGASHLMEDLNQTTHLSLVSKENPSRAAIYLNRTETAAFTSGTSLAERGGSYLFFRYLYEQADLGRFTGVQNGDDFLSQLLQSNFRGVENIEQVTSSDFKDLLLGFFATLQLSHTGATDNAQYNFRGINLRAEQNDNRGTVLEGVRLQKLAGISASASVNSPGGIFYNADGQTITNGGNVLNFFAAPGMVPGGAVIRLR